jgi:ABC-type branched-subunit amino acid transport system substrate-binding protein
VRRAVASAAALLVAAGALAGCGTSLEEINRGGRISGSTLNVYSLLPEAGKGAGRDIVDAEKLALYEARGTVGEFAINFLSIDEGAPGGRDGAREATVDLRDAVADPQVIAMIGPAGSDTARAAVPLLNAAGILELLPGAGYPGFTDPLAPGEPQRWQPAGRVTLARIVGDDTQQAETIVRAAARATGRRSPRLLVEQEPGPVADAFVDGLRDAGAELVEQPGRADAFAYAGEDPENASAVADDLAREHPSTPIVLPDALTRAGVADRLSEAARCRAVLVSAAPVPGSTEPLRRFEAAFRERFDRAPGPYAAIGYEAMRSVLAAIAAAGDRAGTRQAVIDGYFDAAEHRGTVLGDYDVSPRGQISPARFVAFRMRGGRAEYLR